MQPLSLTRQCPKCFTELSYKSKTSHTRAVNRNDVCRKCCYRKNSLPEDVVSQILNLNSQKVLNREIARRLNINHRTVAYYLLKHDKNSAFANQPIDIVSKTEACCKRCKEIKLISEFQFGRKGQKYEYKFSYCNVCRKKQLRKNLNSDINKFLSDKFNYLKRRADKLNIPFSLLKEEFIKQYHIQNGLCFYSDIVMKCEYGKKIQRHSLSVDKIIPEIGYVKGNFVFCSNKINTCKCDLTLDEIEKWMPSWHERIKSFLNV